MGRRPGSRLRPSLSNQSRRQATASLRSGPTCVVRSAHPSCQTGFWLEPFCPDYLPQADESRYVYGGFGYPQGIPMMTNRRWQRRSADRRGTPSPTTENWFARRRMEDTTNAPGFARAGRHPGRVRRRDASLAGGQEGMGARVGSVALTYGGGIERSPEVCRGPSLPRHRPPRGPAPISHVFRKPA